MCIGKNNTNVKKKKYYYMRCLLKYICCFQMCIIALGFNSCKKSLATSDIIHQMQDEGLISQEQHNEDYEFISNIMNAHNDSIGIIYVLDASCSMCIATFIDFCDNTLNIKKDITIGVLIKNQHTPKLDFYLSLWDKGKYNQIRVISNHDRVDDDKISFLNGVIFI